MNLLVSSLRRLVSASVPLFLDEEIGFGLGSARLKLVVIFIHFGGLVAVGFELGYLLMSVSLQELNLGQVSEAEASFGDEVVGFAACEESETDHW